MNVRQANSAVVSTSAKVPAAAPAVALPSIILGTALAVLLVPELDYNVRGALAPSAVALIAGMTFGTVVAALRNINALFRAENVLMFGIVYWVVLEVLLGRGNYFGVSHEAVTGTIVAIGVFATGIWFGSVLISLLNQGRFDARRRGTIEVRFLFAAALFSGVMGLTRYIVGCDLSPACLVDAFYQTRFGVPWWRPDTFGDFDTLFYFSRYFGFIVVPLTVALVMQEGRITWRGVLVSGISALSLVFMFRDGGRKDIGTAVGCSLLVWTLLQTRFRLADIVRFAVVIGGLLVVMQWMLIWRDVGVGAGFGSGVSLNQSNRPIGTVDSNFNFLAHIVDLVPQHVPHNGWEGVLFALTLWVPFPLPFVRTRGIDLPSLIGLDVGPGFSWTCSAIGDLYLIGGYAAIVTGGILFGAAASWTSHRFMPRRGSKEAIVYALITMTLFVSLRALHEIFVTGLIVGAFALLLSVRRALLRAEPRTTLAPWRG